MVYKVLFSLGLTLLTVGTVAVANGSFRIGFDFFHIETMMYSFTTPCEN